MLIQIKTKEEFKEAKKKYEKKSSISWKMYMWDFFKENTCYIEEQDCFISLDRALKLGKYDTQTDKENTAVRRVSDVHQLRVR